jgi:hypothetical protein
MRYDRTVRANVRPWRMQAQNMMGLSCYQGLGSCKKDAREAVRWWRRAGAHTRPLPSSTSTSTFFVNEATQRVPTKVRRLSWKVNECQPLAQGGGAGARLR